MEENDGDCRKSGPFVVELLTGHIHSLHEGSPCRHFGEVTNECRVVNGTAVPCCLSRSRHGPSKACRSFWRGSCISG